MYNQRNYRGLMILLMLFIWVMYGLTWGFNWVGELLIASYISIIMNVSILVLLTLIVVVFNYILQKEKEDKQYRHKKHKTDKKKQLGKELKRSGFDPENLKDYLEE